ncbi:hypothetical protein OnM2_058028 [Erysiphe neolycopersici]|uniref:Uncharacterized protein n=1 Tax=Erysiphe neolycopersici TaxID=212602 RepID=A0A420HQM2_9PEZI|nr:hypothetical protein OnM2_058028 [Erysiphe neolycopersici]
MWLQTKKDICVTLLVLLLSISMSNAQGPGKIFPPITMIRNDRAVKCSETKVIWGATVLQERAKSICSNEQRSPPSCRYCFFRKRTNNYNGKLFRNALRPLIKQEMIYTGTLNKEAYQSRYYIIVKWERKTNVCERIGVLHKPITKNRVEKICEEEIQITDINPDYSYLKPNFG